MTLQAGFARLKHYFSCLMQVMSDSSPKTFLRSGKVVGLLLLGLLVYGVTLMLWVPAGWVWQQASSHVGLPHEIRVNQVSGQLWDGAAAITVIGFPTRLQWHLQWPALTELQLPVKFSLTTSQSRLQGEAKLNWPASARLQAVGRVAPAEFETLIRQSGGAVIGGEVKVDRLSLEISDNRIQQAEGLARWPGGLVTWPMGNQTGQADFPPMQATLDTHSTGLLLTISEQGGEGPAAETQLQRSGMMDIRVYKRMVDLAQQPWPDSARPNDVIFRVQQPLLPGGF